MYPIVVIISTSGTSRKEDKDPKHQQKAQDEPYIQY